jgi:hypothetical protein
VAQDPLEDILAELFFPPETNAADERLAQHLWWQLQLALWLLSRTPQPGRSWGERPMAMLLDILRFAMESPGPRWRGWL